MTSLTTLAILYDVTQHASNPLLRHLTFLSRQTMQPIAILLLGCSGWVLVTAQDQEEPAAAASPSTTTAAAVSDKEGTTPEHNWPALSNFS